MAVKKFNLIELRKSQDNWLCVLEENLSEDVRTTYTSRKQAVDMYINEISVSKIEKATGIKSSNIIRYVKKCIEINPSTGDYYGYVALLPYKHTKKYIRKTKNICNCNGMSGTFNKLLEIYPSLKDFIYGNYFGVREYTLEKNMTVTTLHRKFLNECNRLGIQDYDYPFNTNKKGYMTLRKYIQILENENLADAVKRQNKNTQQKLLSTGYGIKYSTAPIAPYSVVQLDGHRIDLLYTVEVEDKNGSIVRMPATRMWLIAVIDVATRAIIGYSLTPNENYNQTDVLSAIRASIQPRKQIIFTINGFEYPGNGGFPSCAFPEIEWALFDTIMLDNAKSHLSKDVMYKLTEKLKCTVSFGSVATPETRGIVERLFLTLENQGYHKLPFTTGSNISDNKRKEPEKEAVKYNVTYEDISEITEYFISQYNNSAHSSLENQTPLQAMERKIREAGMMPCIVAESQQELVNGLTNYVVERTIRGGYSSGKRPHITYMGVTYRNDTIGVSMKLIGQKILLEVNPHDISFVRAYLSDGSELGILTASGEWGRKSHSIKTREAALKRQKNNLSLNSPFAPVIDGLEQEYRERGIKNRRDRTKADTIRKEKGEPLLSEQYEQKKVERSNIVQLEKRCENYTKEQLDEIGSLSIEEAYKRSLL